MELYDPLRSLEAAFSSDELKISKSSQGLSRVEVGVLRVAGGDIHVEMQQPDGSHCISIFSKRFFLSKSYD